MQGIWKRVILASLMVNIAKMEKISFVIVVLTILY